MDFPSLSGRLSIVFIAFHLLGALAISGLAGLLRLPYCMQLCITLILMGRYTSLSPSLPLSPLSLSALSSWVLFPLIKFPTLQLLALVLLLLASPHAPLSHLFVTYFQFVCFFLVFFPCSCSSSSSLFFSHCVFPTIKLRTISCSSSTLTTGQPKKEAEKKVHPTDLLDSFRHLTHLPLSLYLSLPLFLILLPSCSAAIPLRFANFQHLTK